MFEVIHKISHRVYKVFDIIYDKAGYPHFLLHDGKIWVRISAKYFEPFEG